MNKFNLYPIPEIAGISKKVIFIAGGIIIFVILACVFMMQKYGGNHNQINTDEPLKIAVNINNNDDFLVHKAEKLEVSHAAIIRSAPEMIVAKKIEINTETEKAYASNISIYTNVNQEQPSISVNNRNTENLNIPDNNINLPSDANNYKEQNMQPQKERFLHIDKYHQKDKLTDFEPQFSPYTVSAGNIIPAVLNTAINSDLPGFISAQVARDVFDSATGNYLLIPQGAKLLGRFDSQVSFGQSRILIAWNRLIFPNGASVSLENMPGVDNLGAAGLKDKVDAHYLKIFGSALMYSVIGAAGQLSQPQNTVDGPSPQQVAFGAVGQQLAQTGGQLLSKEMNVQPTLVIRAGTSFNVLLSKDLILPRPSLRGAKRRSNPEIN